MTQTYFPFDSGQGANVTENQWSKMAQHWLRTGVIKGFLNDFQVYADSTGMRVKVKSGQAWIKGHFFESDAEEVLPINTGSKRIDRVIIRLDWTANTIQLAILQGATSPNPVPPALTQNSSRWEISLAQVFIDSGVNTITAGNVTDERILSEQPYARYYQAIEQGIPTSEYTTIPLGVLAIGNIPHVNNKMSIPEKGLYHVSVVSDLSGLNEGTFVAMYFVINGARTYATGLRGPTGWGGNTSYIPLTSAMLFKLNEGDTIEVQYLNIDGYRAVTYQQVSIIKVGN